MISKPTVLVLGAGASHDYGFPTGRQLMLNICRDSVQGNWLFQFLEGDMGFGGDAVDEFRQALELSQAPSIDRFLAHRAVFQRLGKAAIAATLLRIESYAFRRHDPSQMKWYEFLFRVMIDGGGAFEANRLSVITFNYDRSLEAFWFSALRHLNGLSEDAAIEMVEKIPVFHVHGQLERRLWRNPIESGYRYGLASELSQLAPAWVKEAADGIRVLREDEELPNSGPVLEVLTQAQEVLFLGFGFHGENVKRLSLSEVEKR